MAKKINEKITEEMTEKKSLKRMSRYEKEKKAPKTDIVLDASDMKSDNSPLSFIPDISDEENVREKKEEIIAETSEDVSEEDSENSSSISSSKELNKSLNLVITCIVIFFGLLIVKSVLEIIQLCTVLFTDLTNLFCILGILILIVILGYCVFRLFNEPTGGEMDEEKEEK